MRNQRGVCSMLLSTKLPFSSWWFCSPHESSRVTEVTHFTWVPVMVEPQINAYELQCSFIILKSRCVFCWIRWTAAIEKDVRLMYFY